MICLNCGRPNPSGTALCSRCRQRRPGLERARGGVIYPRTRETARVGNRGPGILAVGVLLLAGLIFAGGTLAVLMGPRADTPSTTDIAGLPGPTFSRLEIFQQETPTPAPTPVVTPGITPWFPSASPSFGLSPSPSFGVTFPPPTPTPGTVTPPPRTPRPTPRPTPTPRPDTSPKARFTATQQGASTSAKFNDNSAGGVIAWVWQFEGGGTSTDRNPTFDFGSYGPKSVTLTVTDADGDTDSLTKTVNLQEPTTPPTDPPPTDPPPASEPPPGQSPTA